MVTSSSWTVAAVVAFVALVALTVAGLLWYGSIDQDDPVDDPRAEAPLPPPVGSTLPAIAPDDPVLVAWLSEDVAEVIPLAYFAALRELLTYAEQDDPAALARAEAQLFEAIDVLESYEGAGVLGLRALIDDARAGQAVPRGRIEPVPVGAIKYVMYLAFCDEQQGRVALRDGMVAAGLFPADAYRFHFTSRPLAEVLRFELLMYCFGNHNALEDALRRHADDHGGALPQTLAALVPDYLPRLPVCPMTGEDVYSASYRLAQDGRDFGLRCDGHPVVNGGPLGSGEIGHRVSVNPTLEQTYKVYPMLLGDFLDLPRRDTFLAPMLEMSGLQPGEVVADVGAGAGLFTFPFAEHVGATGRVMAVDINASVLAYVAAVAEHAGVDAVETVHSARHDIGIPADTIDVAFVIQTYHATLDLADPANEVIYEREVRPWLTSIHRALKPGGRLVVQDGLGKMTTELVKRQVTAVGFETVRTRDDWDSQFVAVFRKPR